MAKSDTIEEVLKELRRIAVILSSEGLNRFHDGVEAKLLSLKEDSTFATILIRRALKSSNLEICELAEQCVWEKLHTGKWDEVASVWRLSYAVVSLYKAGLLLTSASTALNLKSSELDTAKNADSSLLLHSLLVLDKALLMCGRDEIISRCASEIHQLSPPYPTRSALRFGQGTDTDTEGNDSVPFSGLLRSSNLIRVENPSLTWFLENALKRDKAVVVSGGMSNWKALELWKDPNYFLKIAGQRSVPVEFGSNYTSSSWGQKIVRFGEFLCDHVVEKSNDNEKSLKRPRLSKGSTAYLAQHELFLQIPELEQDIGVPDYCSLTLPGQHNTGKVALNIWFGPKGTVSPFHHDPKHNLLAQIVGSKRILLASPSESGYMYPNESILSNTSQVDVENIDDQAFPNFRKVKFQELLLSPGEMLYIPPKHWHYVKSLETSISVSFWW